MSARGELPFTEFRARERIRFGNSFKNHASIIKIVKEDFSRNFNTGWFPLKTSSLKISDDYSMKPDITFLRKYTEVDKDKYLVDDDDKKVFLYVEIKPKTTDYHEMLTGIGQIVVYLRTHHFVIFVCYEKWSKALKPIYNDILYKENLAFIFYNDVGEYDVYPEDTKISGLHALRASHYAENVGGIGNFEVPLKTV